MDLTDKINKLGNKLKAKNYLYNAIQTVITFLTTLPTSTSSKEEVREVTN